MRTTETALSAGYKQTEVGIIPDDWQVKPLGDVTHLQVGYAFKSAWFSDSGIPLLRGENVGYGRADWSDKKSIPDSMVQLSGEYRLQPGDVVIGMDRTFTKSGAKISRLNASDCPCLLVQRVGRFRPHACTSDFLWVLLASHQYRRSLSVKQKGMDIPHLSRSEILAPLIPFPSSLAEQEAIAEALGDADAWIASLEQLVAKKRQLKQAAMQKLLTGKTRLPGFEGAWEIKRLGELGSTYGGLTGKSKTHFGHGGARYIPFMNIMSNEVIDPNDLGQVDVQPFESQNEVAAGDLFFNGSSETPEEVGMCSYLTEELGRTFVNSFCFGFRPRESNEVNGLFLAYYLRSQCGRDLLRSLAQGATRYNLSKTAIMEVELRLPSRSEQDAIAYVFSDMDAEVRAIEVKLSKARQIKQGMMQELLTGRTRLV